MWPCLFANFINYLIKTKWAVAWTSSNLGFFSTQGQVTKVNSRILPNFKLVQDFMPVLFKFHNGLIKNKNIELVRDLMSALVTCNIEEDLITK